MANRLHTAILNVALLQFAAGCTTGVVGGKPQLPLSDKNGTTRVFAATESQTVAAITNTFAEFSYRGMVLRKAAESEEILRSNSTMNGFVLSAMHEPIAKVPLDAARTKWVPYIADFHIAATPDGPRETKVTVRTILAEVVDGKEPGIHTEWANHYRNVPSVRQEEQNVLAAIAEQLESEGKNVR